MSAIEQHYPLPCPFCAIAEAHPPPGPYSSVIPSSEPSSSPTTTGSSSSPVASASASGSTPSDGNAPSVYLILNTPHVLAFLDHAPISRGHVLLVARHHRPKLSDCRVGEAQALGGWLPVVSRAVMAAVHGHGADEFDDHDVHGVDGDVEDAQDFDARLAASAAAERSGRVRRDEDDDVGDWNIVQNNGARAAQVVPHVHFHIIPRSGAVPEVKARSWTIFGRGQREDLDDDDADTLVHQIRDQLSHELDDLLHREGPGALAMLLGTHSHSTGSKL